MVFSPNFGLTLFQSNNYELNMEGNQQVDVSDGKALYNAPTTALGFDMHFINEKNGFSFTLLNDFALSTTVFKSGGFGTEKLSALGCIWTGSILFGWTYGVRQPLSFHLGFGPATSFGAMFSKSEKVEHSFFNLAPIAILFSVQYCFTDNLGINFNILEAPGFSSMLFDLNKTITKGTAAAFGNTLSIKLGFTYRK